METATSNEEKPAKAKAARKKKTLDLSSASQLIPIGLLEEYIEYRRADKKKPLTQQALTRSVSGFAKSAQTCAIPIEWVVKYTMDREWLTARPEWIQKSLGDIQLSYGEKEKPSHGQQVIPFPVQPRPLNARQAYWKQCEEEEERLMREIAAEAREA